MKKFILLSFALLLSFILVACEEAEVKKADADDKTEKSSKEKSETQELAIGETVEFDGMKITLNEARIEPGGEFDEPQEDQFIVVNLTAENNTEKEQVMSSIMNVELKDADGYSYSTTILTEGTKAQFDGNVEAGGKLRGEIPFDVAKSDSYELHFSDPFKSGKAIWKIPADKLSE
ncbi:hypothetical protein J32TS6_40720 [Virgibacillus pantothenticus]|uniref:DUF4352 domain-containing protein n=1 Tax=Virgibacillus TaxID=84406 RepID=UPI000909817D|nr:MULTISPECIES: DUF4352 domain-containing protein [Virgibacillus]API91706.1 hypothetical protein BKP57_07615 [Virgibacillus sp. 6R]MBS7427820.1 DUF4352 domain-containing protein [Virgibacillus sp. 19R1-5]GIP65517.1 hypothetical protein J32TS6_40720 [Virgibacillus pantothenticus]